MKKILIIYNPTSGRHRRHFLDKVVYHLNKSGCSTTVQETKQRGDAEAIAGGILADDYDVLAIAGGDGTISEVVNGMSDRSPSLAVIPLGTANVLAAEIGLKPNPENIARTIAQGCEKPLNLGVANDRRFIMMAGVGLDAHIVKNVSPRLKRVLGKGAYVVETIRQIMTFPYPRYEIKIGRDTYESAQIIIANGQHYGGKYTVAPKADISSQGFEACLLTSGGRMQTVSYGRSLLASHLANHPKVNIMSAKEVSIDGPTNDPVQLDGDVASSLPLHVRPAKDVLKLIVPQAHPA